MIRNNGIGAVVVDTEIDLVDALHHAVAEEGHRRYVNTDDILRLKFLIAIVLCQIAEFGRNRPVDGDIRPLAELSQRKRQRKRAAEGIAVGVDMGQKFKIIVLLQKRGDFIKRYHPHGSPPRHL